jgi:predicted RecA/RadA family phage recombinase
MRTFSITTIAIAMAGVTASSALAQIAIPDGTKLRVRLDQTISSATADEGQTVELSVTEPVKIGDLTVIGEGARVTGTITQAQEKRRMGRAGHLDFSIDRVRAIDGEWIPLRYTLNKKSGDSHAVRTGVITAGVAAVFWPAAPVFLLMKGKDTTINKGVIFDAFTDENHTLKMAGPANPEPQMQTAAPAPAKPAQNPSGSASVTITSTVSGADIEIDGAFVGSTPTTLQLAAGAHQVNVKSAHSEWSRALQVSPGSNINLSANLIDTTLAATHRR